MGSKGNEGLESLEKFPKRIALDTSWHKTIDQMRGETRGDGVERFTVIGFREDSRDFYFPEVAAPGDTHSVPRAVKGDMYWRMWEKYKITSILGDFHTHLGGSEFSIKDLWGLLNRLTAPKPFLEGVATEHENIFAFRTRETFMVSQIDTTQSSFKPVFEDYWLEKAGYKYDESRVYLVPIKPDADIWKASLGIAEAHRLALYRGKPGQDLIRAYP